MKKLAILSFALAAQLAAAQRGGPPRRIENPGTIQVPGGARVEFRKFHSPSVGKEAAYSVFLPPSYDQDPNRKFPVVYFLHGMNNDHTSWAVTRYGDIPGRIGAILANGRAPEFLMVHPDGENSFYTNTLDGSRRYEDLITQDLIEEVEKTFRAETGKVNRAIGGTSMGGYGALKIAMKHPELYGSVAADSPIVLMGEDPPVLMENVPLQRAEFYRRILAPIFGDPFDREQWKKNSVETLARNAQLKGLNIYFAYGTGDRYNNIFPMEESVRALDRILTERGVPHTLRIFEGEPHGWELVIAHLEETIPFLTQTF